MPSVTSSRDRSRRRSNKPVTKGQNPQRANRQQMSQAKVTKGGRPRGARSLSTTMRAPVTSDATRPSGGTAPVTTSGSRSTAPGTSGATRNATPTGPRNPQSQIASARMRNTLRNSAALRNAAKIAQTVGAIRGMSPAAIAYETLKARPLADGTLKGKPTGAKQGPAVPKRLTQAGINKGSFDDAFRNARKAGKKEFSWRGKRYNTKMKGEK